jgi:hypothetical protein
MVKPTPEQIANWIKKNFDYKVRKDGDEYIIASPFYGNDKMKMNISCSKCLVHDWRGDGWAGGRSPTFLRFVQLYRKCSFAEAVREVTNQKFDASVIYDMLRKQNVEIDAPVSANIIKLPDGSSPLLNSDCPKVAKPILNWLKSRGVDEDKVKKYNIHHMVDRVIWPYYEYEDLVYWQSRSYINKIFLFPDASSGASKGMFLYGFDMVEPSDYLIVVEAIFGVMTLGEQCVASGGAAMTDLQVRKLRSLNPVRGVILAPDNDEAGIKSLFRNYKLISPYFKVYYSLPPKITYIHNNEENVTKDWNELSEHIKMSDLDVSKTLEKNIKELTPSVLAMI